MGDDRHVTMGVDLASGPDRTVWTTVKPGAVVGEYVITDAVTLTSTRWHRCRRGRWWWKP